MKLKLNFITNSSSTCFCAWGLVLYISYSEFPEKTKKEIFKYIKNQDNNKDDDEFTYEYFLEMINDFCYDVHKFFKKYNLSIESRYHDLLYIGVKPETIPEDKTIRQVKDETKQKLAELGFNVSNFNYIEEAWYDG